MGANCAPGNCWCSAEAGSYLPKIMAQADGFCQKSGWPRRNAGQGIGERQRKVVRVGAGGLLLPGNTSDFVEEGLGSLVLGEIGF